MLFLKNGLNKGFAAFFMPKISSKKCWSILDTLVSGSPIIQNGKLIGAVTHVLVDDPKKGYGIFAENMLETAKTVGEGIPISRNKAS